MSPMEMLADKYSQKAEIKRDEFEIRRMELEFAKQKHAAETGRGKQKWSWKLKREGQFCLS